MQEPQQGRSGRGQEVGFERGRRGGSVERRGPTPGPHEGHRFPHAQVLEQVQRGQERARDSAGAALDRQRQGAVVGPREVRPFGRGESAAGRETKQPVVVVVVAVWCGSADDAGFEVGAGHGGEGVVVGDALGGGHGALGARGRVDAGAGAVLGGGQLEGLGEAFDDVGEDGGGVGEPDGSQAVACPAQGGRGGEAVDGSEDVDDELRWQ